MTNLYLILSGSGLFAATALFANIVLQGRRRLSYEQQPMVFVVLYSVTAAWALWIATNAGVFTASLVDALVVLVTGAVYALVGYLWVHRVPAGDHRERFKVPSGSQISFHFTTAGQFTKVLEICLQQACALLVVTGLFGIREDMLWVSLVFALVVFTVHWLGPRFFGPVFGYFFLVSSTLVALVYPLIISTFPPYGFAVMVALHTATYIYWYSYLINRLQYDEKARE